MSFKKLAELYYLNSHTSSTTVTLTAFMGGLYYEGLANGVVLSGLGPIRGCGLQEANQIVMHIHD